MASRQDKLFQRRKAKTKGSLSRREANKDQFGRVLIVAEGSKTEPKYFKALLKHLGFKPRAGQIDENSHTCPLALAQRAVELLRRDPDFDLVFVVFDRDTHSKYFNAIDYLKNKSKKIRYINSTPCFEFWFYLHIEKSGAPINAVGNKSAGERMVEKLKGCCEELSGYEKGTLLALDYLMERLDYAVENSRQIESEIIERGDDPDASNPFTRVHKMVKKLRKMKK
jgi:hypothetical protein